MRFTIRDGVLRDAGDECGGTGSFSGVHATAPFDIVDADGVVVASGVLPQGRAEKSFDVDFGDLAEPTECEIDIEVPGVSDFDGLSIRVEGERPVAILDPHPEDDEPPTAVVP